MAWLGDFGLGKVAFNLLALFAVLFVVRALAGGKPDLSPVRRRRRRR